MYADWKEVRRVIRHENDDNCCTVVATAIACNVRFSKAKRLLASISGRRKNRGVPFRLTHDKVFKKLGRKLKPCITWGGHPTMITLERWAKKPENTNKIFLVYTRQHVLTIRQGEVVDHSKGSKRKIQAVYEVLPLTGE